MLGHPHGHSLRVARLPLPACSPAPAADIIFVSVNTPTKTSGIGAGKAADLSYWESAARLIASACKGKAFKVVVEKSTVPVKTAEAISKVLDWSAPAWCWG